MDAATGHRYSRSRSRCLIDYTTRATDDDGDRAPSSTSVSTLSRWDGSGEAQLCFLLGHSGQHAVKKAAHCCYARRTISR